MRHLSLLALVLFLAAKSAAAPIAGTWEGKVDGHKEITLDIREDGKLHGTAVFYIRERDYAPASPVEIESPRRDGTTLTFFVTAGGSRVDFVMKVTAAGRAELRRVASRQFSELVIPMAALR